MSGVSSPVYGSGGGYGGAKLPSNVLNLSGTIRDEAVNWSAGATCVAVLEMIGANPVSDTQISGGLWATAAGLEFRDGTNVAPYACTWESDNALVIALTTTAAGKMKLGCLDMTTLIDYGDEVDFDPTSFTPPVGLATSDVGTVERVIVYTGELSASKIEKLTGEKIGTFDLFFGGSDELVF